MKWMEERTWKRIIASILIFAMAVVMLRDLPVSAETSVEKYPYMMFAASTTGEAIAIHAENFCANGDIAANAAIASSGHMHVNGEKTEHAGEEMILISEMLNDTYFCNQTTDLYDTDCFLSEQNIHVANPMSVDGELKLQGNSNLN